jgi:magnesium transporter
MAYFTKRYHPPGTPPGTLVADTQPEQIVIQLIDYTEQEYTELECDNPRDCQPYLDRDSVTWVHIQGLVHANTLYDIGGIFGLHPLALEDVANTGQRPKADSYGDQLFVVMNLPAVKETGGVAIEQVSLFLDHNIVISFHHGTSLPFEAVKQRLRKHSGKIRERSADYLLYALLDVTIDRGFPVLEFYGEYIEELEEELLASPDRSTLAKIHHIKRELLMLRRMLWPQREVINTLGHEEQPQIQPATRPYLSDCYDHIIQILDLVEAYREMTASMLDVYLSSISHRLNEVMKVLTVIATIFIPLTFLTGVYGMNFGSRSDSPWAMPELEWYFGYPLLWLLMLGITIGMIAFFKHKKWF